MKAFADSNGDGIGDFPGLTGKLDYPQDLGITTIWLLPFCRSPLKDDGYDISSYVELQALLGIFPGEGRLRAGLWAEQPVKLGYDSHPRGPAAAERAGGE